MKKSLSVAILFLLCLTLFSSMGYCQEETPQQVYDKLLQAERKGDLEEMCKYLTQKAVQELATFSEEEKKQMSEMFKEYSPTEYKVMKDNIQESTAIIYIEGKGKNPFEGTIGTTYGKISLAKENGVWKVAEENWQDQPFTD